MPATRVMIVLGERAWTMQALHLACAMARRQDVTIVLVKMVPVMHPLLLGTEAGRLALSRQDELDIQDFAATAEDYGVDFAVEICQFANFIHAVVDAAEQLEITAVFADVPATHFHPWTQLQRWWLRLQLTWHNHPLYTLEQTGGKLEWTPTILLSDKGIR